MITLSEKSKETASSLLNLLSNNSEKVTSFPDSTPNVEILSNIYKLMVKDVSLFKKYDDLDDNKNDQRNFLSEKRHKEIIEALSFSGKLEPQKVEPTEKKTTKTPKVKRIRTKKKSGTKTKTTTTKESPVKKESKPAAPKKVASESSKVAPVLKSIGGAAALGFAGAAAAISIRGETGAGPGAAMDKIGQIVKNDPEPGYKSYGIFGMNSKAKTVDQFVSQNPQLGFTQKPGTPEFDQEWMEISKKSPYEMYKAQMAWYERNVLNPLMLDLQKVLPVGVATDPRVVAYMADRRIQYGKTMENSALEYAMSSDPTTFINKMTEYDLQNIGKAFSTYLKENPNNKSGLIKRIENRKKYSMEIPNTIGTNIDTKSKENKQLHEELNTVQSGSNTINQTNLNVSSPQQKTPTDSADDRSAYERKSRIK